MDKARLAETLTIICALQKQYGKTEKELEILVEGFSRVLRRRPIQAIIDAIETYSLTNAGIPAPADIENIINPPPPKIDWALYIELKKRLREGNVYVDQDEKQFLRDCEAVGVDRMRGETQNYQNAQLDLQRFDALRLADHSE